VSTDPDTIAFYDRNAADYAQFAEDARDPAALNRFMDALAPGARVLDLGCGTGWAAATLAASGFQADAMDASAGLIAEAAARHGLAARKAHFRTLSARHRYDGIWCNFALQHAPRPDRPQIFERMEAALKPGGLLYIGVQKGPMDWRDDHGRLYCPFLQSDMEAFLTTAGFTDLEFEQGTGKNFDGSATLNLYVWARKNG